MRSTSQVQTVYSYRHNVLINNVGGILSHFGESDRGRLRIEMPDVVSKMLLTRRLVPAMVICGRGGVQPDRN
jgi:hypothetical protein